MAKVYVTIFGNYKGYRPVNYRYKNKEIKTNSPLKVFSDIEKNIEKFIVLIPISVLNKENLRENIYSYQELENFVKEDLKKFLKEKTGIEDIENEEKYKIYVIPSSGRFNLASYGEAPFILDFKNALSDILAFMYYVLDREIPFEKNEVILDITHGVNFFPLYLKNVLENLLVTRKYFNNYSQNLKIYCSDPFVQGLQDQTLNINLISELEIENKNFENLVQKLKDSNSVYSPKDIEKNKIYDLSKLKLTEVSPNFENLSTVAYLRVFVRALSKNLPLLISFLIHKASENFVENLEKHIENIFEEYKKGFKLEKEEENLFSVKRNFEFKGDRFEAVYLAFLLLKAIKKALEEENISYPTSKEDIEKLANIIEYAKEFIIREVNNIYNTLKRTLEEKGENYFEKGKYYPLTKLFKEYQNSEFPINQEEYERIYRDFLAHGGILNIFTEFCRCEDDDKKILLRYKEDLISKFIKSCLIN